MQFSASEKTDGGGEERLGEEGVQGEGWGGGGGEKMERKTRMCIVYCILKFRHKIVAHVCIQGRQFSSIFLHI